MKGAALAFGVLFGFALGWARLGEYDTIHDMLMWREPYVFLIMGAGMAVAFAGQRALHAAGAKTWALATREPVAWTMVKPRPAHVWGSVLFGVGWAVTGTCPGPALVMIGRGTWSGLFTAGGMLLGVTVCDVWQQRASATPTGDPCAPATVL